MKEIVLRSQNKVAIIDDEDYELVSGYKWYPSKRRGNSATYATANSKKPRTTISMHTLIMGKIKGLQVDHINHDGLDNRRCNLRMVTSAQNSYNRGPDSNSTSCYKGVSWHKSRSRWVACVKCFKKNFHIGYFTAEQEAALAYNKKAIELFGKFAYLNIIPVMHKACMSTTPTRKDCAQRLVRHFMGRAKQKEGN